MIGALRHRLVLEEKVQVPDGGGGFSESWQELATVFAAVTPIGGREAMAAGQRVAEQTLRFRIRYRSDVTAALRARFKGRTLSVEAVTDPDGRGHWLDLLCTEGRPS